MKLLKVILFLTIILSASTSARADIKTSLNNVTRDYFDMETALAANNSAKVSEKAQNLIWDINTISDIGMTEAQHAKWFDYLNQTIRASRGVAQGTSINEQKQHFSELSIYLFADLKLFNINSFSVYKQFCSTEGNYWLSKTIASKNPYHGVGYKGKGCAAPIEVLKARG